MGQCDIATLCHVTFIYVTSFKISLILFCPEMKMTVLERYTKAGSDMISITMLILPFLLRSSAFFASQRAFQSFMTNSLVAHDPPSIASLVDRSQRLRQKLYGTGIPSFISETNQLAYPSSSYMMGPDPKSKETNSVSRGFCNWLLPNAIMIGQYPGMTPESNGPSQKECNIHIENMVSDANITLFCCLQSEVPCQLDDASWASDVYLEPYYRREFPRPFTRYSTIAQALTDRTIRFIHNPIEDLSVPSCNDSLLNLLSQLIEHFEADEGDNAIYVHCWGGRGRAGLIGSCLVSLIFPELRADQVLDLIQKAYSTRAGADSMPLGLRRSPQTEQQQLFVKEFVTLVQSERRNVNM